MMSDLLSTGSRRTSWPFGDPSRVTIWGESSGAVPVGHYFLAYGEHDYGLFHAGIARVVRILGGLLFPFGCSFELCAGVRNSRLES